MTTADGIPRTLWLNIVFGIQIRKSKRVRGHLGIGYYSYRNDWGHMNHALADLGFSIVLGKVKDFKENESSTSVSLLPDSEQRDLWASE